MRIARTAILLALVGLVACEDRHDDDTSNAFMEAAQALFADKDAVGGLQSMASKFMDSDAGKQVGDMLTGGGQTEGGGVGQILSGLGSLMGAGVSGDQDGQSGRGGGGGIDLSMLGSILDMVSSASSSGGGGGGGGTGGNERTKRDAEDGGGNAESSGRGGGIDLESMLNVASMFMGHGGKADGLMGLLPMVLDNLGGAAAAAAAGSNEGGQARKHDHSSHSWYMPPVLENLHVMWEHFSNSELGQTLWKNSGLARIVGTMTDKSGRIKYEQILDSFENPLLRRRWIKSLTNFVAEWIAHISDPTIQQRYMTTIQFVGNSFLKTQGFPKSAMFDSSKPAESLSRIVNTGARRHLNMQVDSSKYIKPAVAYIQDLFRLASEKGFIVSRVNARELSNRLSETINNDLISPLLKAYRAYKWSIKSPKCAAHVLCTINQKSHRSESEDSKIADVRSSLTKLASFPAAWTISVKTGISFWSLYGAIHDSEQCFEKYPVDCSEFHEEEIRVTTEAIHSEL